MFSYQKILKNVENAPEFVTKDEFCTICGVCPHYATKVLKNGIIPYVKRRREEQGAKRRYLLHYYDIATKDIIKFAKLYADISECNEKEEEIIKQYYIKRYEKIPDKLSIKEISELLGYDDETIRRWIVKGWIKVVGKHCRKNRMSESLLERLKYGGASNEMLEAFM